MKISPSNTEQGYILRRLIRRIIRLFKKADINTNYLCELSDVIIQQYKTTYPELGDNKEFILEQLQKEYTLFSKTLNDGLKRQTDILIISDTAEFSVVSLLLNCMIPMVFQLNSHLSLLQKEDTG